MAATNPSNQLTLAFDYGEIPATEQKALERHADNVGKIQERQRRLTAENVIKLGKELSEAHKRLSNHRNGTFGKWCVQRCKLSHQHALVLIQTQEVFGKKIFEDYLQNFEPTALYKLASDTCPEDATKKALALARNGEVITHKRSKELIGEYTLDEAESYDDDAIPEEDEPETFDWQAAEFIVATRQHVRSWLTRCPEDEIDFVVQTLRDIANQIESKSNVSS